MTSTVIVQVLVRVLATSGSDHARAANVTVNQECYFVRIRAKRFEDEVSTSAHFVMVISSDVRREQFRLTGFVLRTLHCVVYEWVNFFRWAENLVALRFIVLDEVAAEPELVSRVSEWLRAQTQFRLDDSTSDVTTVVNITTQNTPHIRDVFRRTIEQLDSAWWHEEVDHLRVFNVAHALVVTDNQCQERHQHHTAIRDVAVEQVNRVSDTHVFSGFVDVVHQRVNALGEIIGGANFNVSTGGRFCCQMRSRFQIAIASFWLHFVGNQNVPTTCDQVFFFQAQIRVTSRLVHDSLLD